MQYQSATLTEGHFEDKVVKTATRIAEAARTKGKHLGDGNFGRAFLYGGHVVKYPRAGKSGYGHEYTPEQYKGYLLHEAGVANELVAAGHAVVPTTVYVELADGTPALVREYGDTLKTVSTEEIGAMETALRAIEDAGEHGWDVADELLVLRRENGSLFVADVGWWRVRDQKRQHDWSDHSDVPALLSRWAKAAGLPENVWKILGEDLKQKAHSISNVLAETATSTDPNDVYFDWLADDLGPELARPIAERGEVGLPVPDDAWALLAQIEAELARVGRSIDPYVPRDTMRKLRRQGEMRRRRTERELGELRAGRAGTQGAR